AAPVDCHIQIHNGEYYTQGGRFEVEEYKKPEYEVRISPAVPRVLEGQPIHAMIEAKYYFGEPVVNAKVKWVVHRQRTYSGLNMFAEEAGEAGGGYSDEADDEEGAGSDTERYYNREKTA